MLDAVVLMCPAFRHLPLQLEMSQQVGYESAPAVIAAGAGAGGAAAHAAKQRLRAVTRLAGNGSNPKDALDML